METIPSSELYNIHGFIISVEGNLKNIFREYEWAKIKSSQDLKINLYVKPCKHCKDLPTKPLGRTKGMYIPFSEDENTLWYEEGVPLNILGRYVRALLWWPDKTLLHAAAVARRGDAFIFTGGGDVGKTSACLNLLKQGYDFLSDDYLIIDGRGYGYLLSTLINLSSYNIKDREIAKLALGQKWFFYKAYLNMIEFAGRKAPHRYLRYVFNALRPSFPVEVEKLFPDVKIAHSSKIQLKLRIPQKFKRYFI